MNPAVYIALNGIVIASLFFVTPIMKRRSSSLELQDEYSFKDSLNQVAYQSMMTISIIVLLISVLLNLNSPPYLLEDRNDELQRYVVLGCSLAVPFVISFRFVKPHVRIISFVFCWVFHFLAIRTAFILDFQVQTIPMMLLSTILVGILCPAPSTVLIPYIVLMWLGDMMMFIHKVDNFFNSPFRSLFTNIGICFAIGAAVGFITYSIREREFAARKALAREREKSDALLHNTLPHVIVQELKEHGRVEARRHPHVTVLFADIAGFTSIAEYADPGILVKWLDEVFVKFDDIAEKYGLEKLKTIGDCYMTVAGAPKHDDSHALNTVHAAFEMIEAVKKFKPHDDAEVSAPFFQMRIGVHSGVVVAGVIGKTKFAYDIWGDTVNIAARLESASEANRINASADTARLIDDCFKCTSRGLIEVKNRAPVEMFWIDKK
jgi:class 3 adenylate cyclase